MFDYVSSIEKLNKIFDDITSNTKPEKIYREYVNLLDDIMIMSRNGEIDEVSKNELSKTIIKINEKFIGYFKNKKIKNRKVNIFSRIKYALAQLNNKNGLALVFSGLILLPVLFGFHYSFFNNDNYKPEIYIPAAIAYFFVVTIILFLHVGGEYMMDLVRNESYFVDYESELTTKQILFLLNHKDEKELIAQYEVCIDLEKHYEVVMWDIGKFLLTGSAAALPLAIQSLTYNSDGYILGFVILMFSIVLYNVFLFLSKRYRASIRKFRNSAELIEKELKWLPYKYAYKLEDKSFGDPIRVWTIFVALYVVIISGATFIFLKYILFQLF